MSLPPERISSPSLKPKLVLFSDEPIMALGLTRLLMADNRFELLSVYQRPADLLAALQAAAPDLVLVDMTPETTLQVLHAVCEAAAGRPVVLCGRRLSEELRIQTQELGIRGFLLRTASGQEILNDLASVLDGGAVFGERVVDRAKSVRLCRRESQIVSLLSQGMKNKEIAYCLNIAEGTVRTYLTKLFQKVGARDRYELAVFGLKNLSSGMAEWDGGQCDYSTAMQEQSGQPLLRKLVLVQPSRKPPAAAAPAQWQAACAR